MNEEIKNDVKRSVSQICDAFSALDFACSKFNNTTSTTDIVSIINTVIFSGMMALNNLTDALEEVESK